MNVFSQYNPYMGQPMQQMGGQQQFDAKYLNDPLLQQLLGMQTQNQILNAFAPPQAQAPVDFLESLMGQTSTPATPAVPGDDIVDAVTGKKKKKTTTPTDPVQAPSSPNRNWWDYQNRGFL